jgi:hypothetical protein
MHVRFLASRVLRGPGHFGRVREGAQRSHPLDEGAIAGAAERTILEDHRIVGPAPTEPPGDRISLEASPP